MPPPVALIVIVCFPSGADFPTFTVIVEVPEPGFGMDLGLMLTDMPPGNPVADKETADLKLPETAVVILVAPELPLATPIELGDALTLKGGGGGTVSETVTSSVMLPDVPWTFML